jgi:DNA-directed RNA polymerase specialized sigma24 family protein
LERLITNRFREDPEAALVLEALLDGKAASEIREGFGLSSKEYETDVKRVRRAVREIIKIVNGGQS